jgi:hypothetical protein
VSKLRENAKAVIGVGVKNSTSDLLIANCDEFIYYDDLVRAKKKAATKRGASRGAAAKPKAATKGAGAARRSESQVAAESVADAAQSETQATGESGADAPRSDEQLRDEAVEQIVETVDALLAERGAGERIWGSMVKQALRRRKPGFNETYYGFRSFNALLEEAARRGELALDHDEKSGGYVVRVTAGDE